MKQKKVWRYYCEFCGKAGCNAGHMKTHEKHCCRNPNRECRMCGTKHRDFAELNKLFVHHDVDYIIQQVDGCPNCMLAIILQGKDKDDPESGLWTWNYKKAVQDWWNEKNAIAMEQENEFYRAAYCSGNM